MLNLVVILFCASGNIDFVDHLLVLIFCTTVEGNAAATFVNKFIVLLLNKPYHNGTVKVFTVKITEDAGKEASLMCFDLFNDLNSTFFGSTADTSCRKKCT